MVDFIHNTYFLQFFNYPYLSSSRRKVVQNMYPDPPSNSKALQQNFQTTNQSRIFSSFFAVIKQILLTNFATPDFSRDNIEFQYIGTQDSS